jgi:hypothetical protein
MRLKAGVGRAEVTPTKPMFLVGYPHVERTSTGVHDPLLATALYLSDGRAGAMLIALDLVFVSRDTTARCRQAIAAETGLRPDDILIGCTHTHSGPVTLDMASWMDDPVVPKVDPEYVAFFESRIVEAAGRAFRAAAPASVAVTSARAEGVGGNRHDRDGVSDPEVGILAVRGENGRLLAVDMVYSMHPTVLHEDSTLVSADFPGYARSRIESRRRGATVLYHTGPCGNQSPRYHVTGQTFAEAERLGNALGDAVLKALDALDGAAFAAEAPVAAALGRVPVPGRAFAPVAEAEAGLRAAVGTFERLKREGAPHGPVRTAECTVFGAEERLTWARLQADGTAARLQKTLSPAEVQVIRVGASYWVGLPGEFFVEYGLRIKREAPGRAFAIAPANQELHGYIVTPEAEAVGGYEAWNSCFTSEAGRRIVDEALRLMRTMG